MRPAQVRVFELRLRLPRHHRGGRARRPRVVTGRDTPAKLHRLHISHLRARPVAAHLQEVAPEPIAIHERGLADGIGGRIRFRLLARLSVRQCRRVHAVRVGEIETVGLANEVAKASHSRAGRLEITPKAQAALSSECHAGFRETDDSRAVAGEVPAGPIKVRLGRRSHGRQQSRSGRNLRPVFCPVGLRLHLGFDRCAPGADPRRRWFMRRIFGILRNSRRLSR